MRKLQPEFDRLGVQIAVITFEADFSAGQYLRETGISWPLLIDAKREIYGAYNMLRAGFLDIWGPSTWLIYIKEIIRGGKLKRSTGDIHQRGGDVLVSPDGIIRLHHVGAGPADRPDAGTILRIIETHHKLSGQSSD